MKLLIVSQVEPWLRSISTIHSYAATGRALGHEVAVFGEPHPDLPGLTFTMDLSGVDLALFVIQVPSDLPGMPHLARLIDNVPRERRIVVDLWGRYNDTIRLEHDFNHLEKLDGHLASEWLEAFAALSGTIVQPTLAPMRADVRSFLFHGFDASRVAKPFTSAKAAAAAWCDGGAEEKPYGFAYVGNNWHRWGQVRGFLEQYAPVAEKVGKACLVGWDWAERPGWAIDNGIAGIDTDPALLSDLGVETGDGVAFDEVVGLIGKARFAPVFHRPLFRHLGYVTNRTFETFCADSLPILFLPEDFVEAIFGPAALKLVPGEDVGAHMGDALSNPEPYWDAVLATREHLAREHSIARRLGEIEALLSGTAP